MCPSAAVSPHFSVIGSRTLGFGRRWLRSARPRTLTTPRIFVGDRLTVNFCNVFVLQVRMKQLIRRQPARRGPRVLRRASTVRGVSAPSMRSLRSGYAFSHQQGFGDLITTGSMMTVRPRPPSTRIKGPLPRFTPRQTSITVYDEPDSRRRQRRRRQRTADHTVRGVQLSTDDIFVIMTFYFLLLMC